MASFIHHEYLRDQYQDSTKLSARISLHQAFSTNSEPWESWLFNQLTLSDQSTVLELGCGTGELWKSNIRSIPSGWRVIVSDVAEGMLRDAWSSLSDESGNSRFQFERINAEAIPFEDQLFDAVIANHMLYHVLDLPHALTEIRRVLKPTGTLYASTNGLRHMGEIRMIAQRVSPEAAALWDEQAKIAARFNLEGGRESLSTQFESIHVNRYSCALRVTEVSPLASYMLSGGMGQLLANCRTELTSVIENELQAHGAIVIETDSGLFQATGTPR